MLKLLFIILLSIIGAMIIHYELLSFKNEKHNCIVQNFKDMDLLSRDVCTNHEDRINFKDVAVNCEEAEKRQRLTIIECSIQNWIKKSLVMHMYNTITQYYYTMMLILIIVIMWYMWLWNKRKSDKQTLDKMQELANTFNQRNYLIK